MTNDAVFRDITLLSDRLNPRQPVPDDCGVMTFGDKGYFAGLQMLFYSLSGHAPLAAVNIGLTAEQAAWCVGRVRLITAQIVMPAAVYFWQSWNRPFYAQDTPYERTLFLGADCIVVGDLNPLFERTTVGPWVTAHWDGAGYPSPLPDEVYQMLPVSDRFPPELSINADVMSYSVRRDQQLLSTWKQFVAAAAADDNLRALVPWADESALHWSLQKLGRRDYIVHEPSWNRFRDSPSTSSAIEFIEWLRYSPNDIVLHFSGPSKPGRNWR